ncbi:hypothetical protein GCM10012287_39680 [Streptomyces daqingensis]|uniref:Lipoprotein n=1 Tax=Streptomyces daqingensis TaxID=1472640 RepID=A0ABQ2MK55_9ACTN|nr:hypothetical protein [Streptomyces daqingensis]GGO53335.1 hypothetical protein GCM10012287_39680 [Streptomyces daqingensis]
MGGPGQWHDACGEAAVAGGSTSGRRSAGGSRAAAPRGGLRAVAAAVTAAALAAACGCGPAEAGDGADRERAEIQRVLDRQATAVRSGHEKRYTAEIDPRAERYRAAQREVFGNLQQLRLTQWTYRLHGLRHKDGGEPDEAGGGKGGGRVEAQVRLRYRLRGDDRAPVTATERLAFVERGGRWYVSGELPGSDVQLWEQGELSVVRGDRSSVLGVGRSGEELRRLARDADRAVSRVDEVWPRPWPDRVVVEAPASLRSMAQLLDAPAPSYEGIAAVTTGDAGESEKAPADRIVVNPEAYGELSEEGRQVVVTHETVHVASRTHTGRLTPMWLSEGLADWIGYRGTGRTPRSAAAELVRAAEAGELPQELPSDRDFKFGNDSERLGRAYESGWLACLFIAEEWGEEKLLDFYLRVGDAGGPDGSGSPSPDEERAAADKAMRAELGLTLDEFTERWRSYVRAELP